MRIPRLAGREIEQHDSPNKGGPMSEHRGIVLHIAEGSYRGTVSWQLNADQRYADGTSVNTSSTWVVGREPGEWAQMVDTDRVAWCHRSGSLTWLSIELAGFAPTSPTAWQIEACAQLLAWAHASYRVPLAVANHPGERGLGHHSMDRENLGEEWGHDSCPGTGVINAKAAIVARAQAIAAGEDDMAEGADIWSVLHNGYDGPPGQANAKRWGTVDGGKPRPWIVRRMEGLAAEQSALRGVIVDLAAAIRAGGGSVDTAAILAGVDERLAVLRAELPDEIADEQAARLAVDQRP
ncbi:MAG: N-acetylmuramoyl-L-alanine amidase [Actinomycetota bacterium]|nr:N-acetylmuramoyl-L-alanine amidase [Actinomycetota bacterium]